MGKEINVLKVEGMSCSHCVESIKNALCILKGIEHVSVNLDARTVTVEYESEVISIDVIKDVIEGQGFDVK